MRLDVSFHGLACVEANLEGIRGRARARYYYAKKRGRTTLKFHALLTACTLPMTTKSIDAISYGIYIIITVLVQFFRKSR